MIFHTICHAHSGEWKIHWELLNTEILSLVSGISGEASLRLSWHLYLPQASVTGCCQRQDAWLWQPDSLAALGTACPWHRYKTTLQKSPSSHCSFAIPCLGGSSHCRILLSGGEEVHPALKSSCHWSGMVGVWENLAGPQCRLFLHDPVLSRYWSPALAHNVWMEQWFTNMSLFTCSYSPGAFRQSLKKALPALLRAALSEGQCLELRWAF